MKKNKRYFLFGIQKRIVGVYFLMMGILTAIIVVLFLFLVQTEIKNQEDNCLVMAERISSQLDMVLTNMDRVALQVTGDNTILESFESIEEHDTTNFFDYHIQRKLEIQNNLLNINGPKLMAGRISLYNQFGDYVSYGKYNESSHNLRAENVAENYKDITKEMSGAKRYFKVQGDLWETDQQQLLSLYRPLKNSITGKVSGIVEVQNYLTEIFSFIDLENSALYAIAIYDDNCQLVYSNQLDTFENQDFLNVGFSYLEESGKSVYQLNHTVIGKSDDYGWYVSLEQINSDLIFGMSRFLVLVLGVILIAIIGTVFLILFISKRLTAPLVELTHLLKKVRMNNLSVVLEEKDETDIIKELNHAFSTMFFQLKRSIENETKINLRILQSQMDPHFLYNVLSVIKAAVYDEKSNQIPMLCDRLSNMLRYSSNYQDRDVSLREEIEYAKAYCELMKARYEEMLEFKICEWGDIDQIQVPKLIIQPLIENCFHHGFADKDGIWEITVNILVSDRKWKITVKDNGLGFPKEKQEEIERMVKLWEENPNAIEQVSGIGLKNTILRLYLFYKEDFSYEIHSDVNQGAEVIVSGPVERKG